MRGEGRRCFGFCKYIFDSIFGLLLLLLVVVVVVVVVVIIIIIIVVAVVVAVAVVVIAVLVVIYLLTIFNIYPSLQFVIHYHTYMPIPVYAHIYIYTRDC